jgi:glycine cleavage system H lipoate-binding protein
MMSQIRYTKDHEYVRVEGGEGVVGISEHAQQRSAIREVVEHSGLNASEAADVSRRGGYALSCWVGFVTL